jgi:hypothetical protein
MRPTGARRTSRSKTWPARSRIARQLVVEGLLLTLTAGVLGILVARWAADALIAFSPVTFPGFVSVGIDRTVLMFTFGVSTILLVGAGLLMRTMAALGAVDPGFHVERMLTLRVSLRRCPWIRTRPPRRMRRARRVRAHRLPHRLPRPRRRLSTSSIA